MENFSSSGWGLHDNTPVSMDHCLHCAQVPRLQLLMQQNEDGRPHPTGRNWRALSFPLSLIAHRYRGPAAHVAQRHAKTEGLTLLLTGAG